jgi:outer membrane protein TolC
VIVPMLFGAAMLAGGAPARVPAQTAHQSQSAPTLTLAEALQASARSAPQIVEALARSRQAEGRALSADGAFDTLFEVDARQRTLGYYNGSVVEARTTQPLGSNGGYVYGGYRVSRGDFPVYEDQAYTNRAGEVKVGALYSLLRDRLIDERRSKRTLAASDINIARFEAAAVKIGVQRRTIDAYQTWVAAGLRLRAYRELLELAERRRGAISRQVQLGARPDILLTENDQNLVRRRALVLRAEQDFTSAANALSLYYRDDAGQPLLVGADRLPADASALAGPAVRRNGPPTARPDVQTLLARVEQSAVKLAVAQNDLRPRLDLRGDVGKDLGREGLGGRSRTPFEASVGVRLSVPLQNRAAKGRLAEARAEIDALEARSRFLRDQITVEVEGINIAVDGAVRLAETAEQERALADRLAAAERRRFELGSSDFFLVNQREETANDARVRLIDAQARIAAARAELAAATADWTALGLPPQDEAGPVQ